MLTFIKILLAGLMLICLANMPYGYYQLVRFLAMVGFGIMAYNANQQGNLSITVTYALLALLFQPIFKVALGRPIWNVIDIIVAIGLIISISVKRKINTNDK